MARGSGTVTVSIIGKADKLKSALDTSAKDLEGFDKKLAGFGSKAANIGNKFTMGVTLPIVGGLGLATKAAVDDEEAQAKLAKTLGNTVGATAAVVEGVESQLTAFSKVSTFSDDELRPAFSNLVRSTKDVGEANSLMTAAMDIAAAKGLPLEQVSMALAKAHDGNVGALGRLGIATKDSAGKTKSFEQVMKDASSTFGGSAADALNTTAGRSKALSRDLGEMTEEIGGALVPILDKLVPIIRSVAEWFSNLSPRTQTIILVVAGLAAAIGPLVTVVGALSKAFAFLAANPIVLVVIAIAALVAGLVLAYQHCEGFRDLVDKAAGIIVGAFNLIKDAVVGVFNWVQNNWPLILGILTGPIGLAVVAIVTHWETIKNAFTAVKNWIGDRIGDIVGLITGIPGRIAGVASTMWDGIKTAFTTVKEWVKNRLGEIAGFFTGMKDKITGAASGMFDGIKNAFRSAVNWLIRAWNGIEFKIPGFDPPGPGPKFGGFTLGVPNIPELADGGIVRRPTLAMIGEAGPEAVIPLGRGGAGTTIINLTVNGHVLGSDEASLARYLNDIIARETRRSG